jgi:hypothetical protein
MQQLKELEQFNQVYKKTQRKTDKLKTATIVRFEFSILTFLQNILK